MPYAAITPYYFFDTKGDTAREREILRDRAQTPLHERRLFCGRCRHVITAMDQRIAMNGSQEHDFINPLGLRFHIVCFRQAPGCSVSGEDTLEHTWFAGYAWSIATCAHCRAHLGWMFRSAEDGFFGLIADRLTS